MTLVSGKSLASEVHLLMLELPTNTVTSFGGGLVLSEAAKAAISFSKTAGSCSFLAFVATTALVSAAKAIEPKKQKTRTKVVAKARLTDRAMSGDIDGI